MLKVVVIVTAKQLQDVQFKKLPEKLPIQIVALCEPGQAAINAIEKFKPDLVINSLEVAKELLQRTAIAETGPRLSIMASTHQGIQLLPIAEIIFFQAADKYVTAHHNKGELLIEDSLTSLELEFTNTFVRIHRKTLVAVAKIEQVYRNDQGQHYLKLRGIEQEFSISRRQLPHVRKILLCK